VRPLFIFLIAFVGTIALNGAEVEAAEPTEDVRIANDQAYLDLSAVIESAVSRHPDAAGLAIQGRADEVRERRSGWWLGAAPSMQLRYQSDEVGSDLGAEEWETMLSLPLTPPGERAARQKAARLQSMASDAEARAVYLRIAGEVREAIWEARLAQVEVEHAALGYDLARAVENAVRRRVEEGDLPANDLALAQADLLAREMDVIDAEAERNHTMRRFAIITGLNRLPDSYEETLATGAGHDGEDFQINDDHPVIALLQAKRHVAAAETRLAKRYWVTKPSVGVGMRSERSFANGPNVKAAGVQLSVPFDFGGFNGEQTSRALQGEATAERELLYSRRQLAMALHDAEQSLEMAQRAQKVALEHDRIGARALASARRSFDMGESDLMHYLNVQNQARQAGLVNAKRRLEVSRAIARLNQAMGQLPQ